MTLAYCPRCERYGDPELAGRPCPFCHLPKLARLVVPDGWIPPGKSELRVRMRAS